ncbi:MAG: transporter permease subunit [Deltaproteobacteria bacterium]|jgi:iron(III) transport system permease protein|nr:transporter permease subunit [Deltaproteobacteria bacterium]
MNAFVQSRGTSRTQGRLLTAVIAAIVLVLLGAPLVILFITSLRPPTALPLDPGVSLDNFGAIFSSPRMFQVLVNTAIYGGGALVLSLSLGATIAFLVERTDIPFRSAIYTAMLVSLAVPTMLKAFGWVLLLSPGLGWINHLLRSGLDLEGPNGPLNIYTMPAMIFVTGIGLSNNAFLMLSPVFRQMNPEFEEAAQTAGSRRLTVLRKITLPLLLPGILSALIYFGMVLVQVMETALAIGVPGGIRVLSVHIYLLTKAEDGLPMYGLAAAFGVVLLLLALLLMLLYFWLTRQQDRFSVVTGKSFRPRQLKLGLWKYIALGFVMLVIVSYALPIFILMWASLVKVYQPPSFEALSQISLQSYFRTLTNPQVRQSAVNTLILVVIAPTVSVLIAFCASWFSVKRKMRWVEVFAMTPMGIPNVVLALAVFLTYVMTPIHGSIWVLIMAHIVAHLPFTTRVLSAALLQQHKELEEAARVTGATTVRAVRTVTLPLLFPALLNGWLWAFSATLRDFTFAIFLMTGRNMILPSAMWVLWNVPDISGTAALGTLYMCGFFFVTMAARYFDKRQRKKAGWEDL